MGFLFGAVWFFGLMFLFGLLGLAGITALGILLLKLLGIDPSGKEPDVPGSPGSYDPRDWDRPKKPRE